MAYAKGTKVPVEQSKAEIEKLLRKHGAEQFQQGWDDRRGVSRVLCKLSGRFLKFEVLHPDPEEYRFTPAERERSDADTLKAAEGELRRRWRARLLIIKAKLEMIEEGESDVDREFMADLVMSNGKTVAEWLCPQIDEMYESGALPEDLLPALPPAPKKRTR